MIYTASRWGGGILNLEVNLNDELLEGQGNVTSDKQDVTMNIESLRYHKSRTTEVCIPKDSKFEEGDAYMQCFAEFAVRRQSFRKDADIFSHLVSMVISNCHIPPKPFCLDILLAIGHPPFVAYAYS